MSALHAAAAGLQEGLLLAHACTYAVVERLLVSSEPPQGLREGHLFPEHRDDSITTRVRVLLDARRPAAVSRTVPEGVVDAVDRVGRRGLPSHVGEECLERVDPPRVDSYPAATVRQVALVGRIQASAFHARPSAVLARHLHPIGGVSVLAARFAQGDTEFFSETTAGSRLARAEDHSLDDFFSSAIAGATPPPIEKLFLYGQATESLPGQIDESHGADLMAVPERGQ